MASCEPKYTTLLDLARQSKIITGNTACLDGKIQAGIPFSGYPTGVDLNTIVSLGVVGSTERAVISGSSATTVFDVSNPISPSYNPVFDPYSAWTWTNPLFQLNVSGLTLPITPLSALTQTVGPVWTLTQTGMTGDHVIGTQYTGYTITYAPDNLTGTLSGFTYISVSGYTSAFQENFSAGTLDYKGPVDYLRSREDATVDNRLTTKKLKVTGGASASTIGYVLLQDDVEGNAVWAPTSAVTSGITSVFINSAATPTTIGGIAAGSTFPAPGYNMQQMWDWLLYPYQYPAFTAFARTGILSEYELGQAITVGAQTFTWNISNGSNINDGILNSIKITEADPPSDIANSLMDDGTEPIVLTTAMSQSTVGSKTLYSIYALNSLGGAINTSISRTWKVMWYYGKNVNASITGVQMTGLTGSDLVTNVVNGYVTQPASGGAEYMYWCIPDILSQPTDIRDSVAGCFGTNIPYTTLADIPITNTYGVAVNYKIYRSVVDTSASFTTWLCS
jgi:hypothetical protein